MEMGSFSKDIAPFIDSNRKMKKLKAKLFHEPEKKHERSWGYDPDRAFGMKGRFRECEECKRMTRW